MSVPSAVTGQLSQLRARRAEIADTLERRLSQAKAEGRRRMTNDERALDSQLRQINAQIEHQESEVRRAGNPSFGSRSQPTSGTMSSPGLPTTIPRAGRLAPLHFSDEQLRRAQVAAQRGETCRLETRNPGFS